MKQFNKKIVLEDGEEYLGYGFGPSGEGYFRLTGFGTREDTEEAIRRIQNKFIKEF